MVLFNLGPTLTALRTVRREKETVFVNTDLPYVLREFRTKIELEEDDARELFDWLAGRPRQEVCAFHLRRVGFAVRNAGESGLTVQRVDVKRVMFATGREHGFEARLLYASIQHKGGPETFWPM